MPIRPENRAKYPPRKVWHAMVEAARERGGNRCECDGRCGTDHGGRCDAVNGRPHPITGSIVRLTLAHFHGEPLESTSIERMMHACERCHNRYDAPMRAAGVKARREVERRRVLDKAGQLAFEISCFGPLP